MAVRERTLRKAIETHESGDLAGARRLFRRIVRVDPGHAEAWYHLGLVEHARGSAAEAAQCLERAAALDTRQGRFHGDLGAVYVSLGRLPEAVESLQQALQLDPNEARVHYNLGIALVRQQNLFGARNRLQQALYLKPDFIEAWNDLGAVCQATGELDQAAVCFDQVCLLAPSRPEGHFNLGSLRLAQGRYVEAVSCLARALEAAPGFPEALNSLGTALFRLGRVEEALAACRLAIQLQDDYVAPRANLGTILSALGRHDEARDELTAALALEPENAATLNSLGVVAQAQAKFEEAEQFFRAAIACDPALVEARGNLAGVLQQCGRPAEAIDAYRQALTLRRDARLEIQSALVLPGVYASTHELALCRERVLANVARLVAEGVAVDPTRELVPVNFLLAYQGGNHCELATSLARLVRSGDVSPAGLIRPAPRREGPLRIGFVSKLFGDSTVGNLTIGLIEGLARRGFAVSVFTAGQAGSSADLLPLPGVQVVKMPETISGALALVARSGLDVLFYPDLGIDPFSYTLAFSRLAPVQCTSWGHPVTSGIPEIDYYVSSRLIEPEGATGHYSEELVLLESLPTRYRRPCAPGKAPDRGEFSLPADVRLYVCPQGLFKFHPDFDDLLKEILTRDPQGRLIIVDAPCRRWTQALLSRWSNSLGSLSERVQVMPGAGPEALLKLLKIADVVLDPLHFCGGNVSLQALGLSVPVVTLPGAFMRGQITAGCYKQMGLSTCIASDRDGYVELACRIAGDREFRQHVSAEIENCSAQLFENNSVVDELARFLQVACTRCQ